MKKEAIRNLIVAGAITAATIAGGAKEAEASSITNPTDNYYKTADTLLIAGEIMVVTALSSRLADGSKKGVEELSFKYGIPATNLGAMAMILARAWGVV